MNQHTWGIVLCSLCHSQHRHDQKEKLSKVERRFVLQKDTNSSDKRSLITVSMSWLFRFLLVSSVALLYILFTTILSWKIALIWIIVKFVWLLWFLLREKLTHQFVILKSGFVRLQQQRLINFLDKIVTNNMCILCNRFTNPEKTSWNDFSISFTKI